MVFTLPSRVKPFQHDHLQAYFFDVDTPVHRELISKYRGLYELFMSADHGSTVSYDRRDEQYIPVLRSQKNEEAINWGLYAMQGATVEFAEQVTTNLCKEECTTQFFLEVAEILAQELVLNPSRQEAEVFGSFLFSGDLTENAFYELAPVYSLVDLWKLLLSGRHPHADAWFDASIARGNFIVRTLFRAKTINKIRKIRDSFNEFKRKLSYRPKAMKTT